MLLCMRTTLTLDDDVAAALQKLLKSRDASLKDVVNQALREGLKQMATPPRRRAPMRTRAVSLGRCRIGNVDNVAEVIAVAEGEGFR